MKYIVDRICSDIIEGCQQSGIKCGFWTNVHIVAENPLHGVATVSLAVPLFVPPPQAQEE